MLPYNNRLISEIMVYRQSATHTYYLFDLKKKKTTLILFR